MGDPEPVVRVERRGPVARLTLDSPGNANALSARLLGELAHALSDCRGDPSVRVMVIAAAGTTFCSGADMAERLEHPVAGSTAAIGAVLSAIATAPHAVVARVQGHVRGGGMGLVAAADMAVAAAGATFAFSEVRVGVAPAVVAVPVLRRMSRRSFERWALTGDVFDAAEAAASGLLSAAVADEAALDAWIDAVVSSVLRSSPAAVAATKTLPDICAGPWETALADAEQLSDALFASEGGEEGMRAFFEKRRPAWSAEWPLAT